MKDGKVFESNNVNDNNIGHHNTGIDVEIVETVK